MSSIESGSTHETDVMDTLAKFLRPSAMHDDAKSTFKKYLGKNSTDIDHSAFLEYIETEYLTNKCQKLGTSTAVKIGIYSLLDGMDVTPKGRLPSLDSLLDGEAFRRGNTSTYEFYLGERHSRESEQEFRQRLHFLKKLFGFAMDELRAQSVAKYLIGMVPDIESQSDSDSDSNSDLSDSQDENDDKYDKDNHRRHVKDSERYSDSESESQSDSQSDSDIASSSDTEENYKKYSRSSHNRDHLKEKGRSSNKRRL
jgi:hypothetical protein